MVLSPAVLELVGFGRSHDVASTVRIGGADGGRDEKRPLVGLHVRGAARSGTLRIDQIKVAVHITNEVIASPPEGGDGGGTQMHSIRSDRDIDSTDSRGQPGLRALLSPDRSRLCGLIGA